jgi:hypothetical protein
MLFFQLSWLMKTHAELNAVSEGSKSIFRVKVAKRFNEDFPSDDPDPSVQGNYSTKKLMLVWKKLVKEYGIVRVNFTKSGNHDISFTGAAIIVLRNVRSGMDSVTPADTALNDDDLIEGDDDELGMESGCWCNFTNNLQLDTTNSMESKKCRASDTTFVCKSQ